MSDGWWGRGSYSLSAEGTKDDVTVCMHSTCVAKLPRFQFKYLEKFESGLWKFTRAMALPICWSCNPLQERQASFWSPPPGPTLPPHLLHIISDCLPLAAKIQCIYFRKLTNISILLSFPIWTNQLISPQVLQLVQRLTEREQQKLEVSKSLPSALAPNEGALLPRVKIAQTFTFSSKALCCSALEFWNLWRRSFKNSDQAHWRCAQQRKSTFCTLVKMDWNAEICFCNGGIGSDKRAKSSLKDFALQVPTAPGALLLCRATACLCLCVSFNVQ